MSQSKEDRLTKGGSQNGWAATLEHWWPRAPQFKRRALCVRAGVGQGKTLRLAEIDDWDKVAEEIGDQLITHLAEKPADLPSLARGTW